MVFEHSGSARVLRTPPRAGARKYEPSELCTKPHQYRALEKIGPTENARRPGCSFLRYRGPHQNSAATSPDKGRQARRETLGLRAVAEGVELESNILWPNEVFHRVLPYRLTRPRLRASNRGVPASLARSAGTDCMMLGLLLLAQGTSACVSPRSDTPMARWRPAASVQVTRSALARLVFPLV
jgi:hypothetical protein